MIKTSLLVISREVFFYFHEQIGFACVCVTVLIVVMLIVKHWRNRQSSS